MNEDCKKLRQEILKISHQSGHGHIPTCFSVVEILYALYSVMKHRPNEPQWPGRDLFVLSKGHAALSLYCVLAHFGYFDMEEVYTFGAFDSRFGCHADRLKLPGVEFSTGSLGHGIGLAVGAALACKIRHEDRRVFTLIGDGEANEGSVWEAVMVAAAQALDNLTIIYDNNMSHPRGLQIANPAEKLAAFGCDIIEVDGHDVSALKNILTVSGASPRAIIANTKKGFGCSTLTENMYMWHRKSPTDQQLNELLEQLDA